MRAALALLVLSASVPAQTPVPEPAVAADAVYCVARVQDLTLVDGSLPTVPTGTFRTARPQPYAVLDGEGVAFVVPARELPGADDFGQGRIAIRLDEPRDVAGRLFVEGPESSLVALRFELPAGRFSADARQDFFRATRDHYLGRVQAGLPGMAWWRHRDALFAELAGEGPPAERTPVGRRSGPSNMDDTFELFSGSRAIAENLQLDRTLPATPRDAAELTVAVETIAGITVADYDWTAAIAGQTPPLDPLATLVPADQHAVFFPSFQALLDVSDEAEAQGRPVLQMLSDPTGEAGSKVRYQRQLALPLSELARLLGPKLIDSVVLTGGDPYLASGSDVAVLFQAKDPAVLHPLIVARVAAAAAASGVADVAERSGEIDGVAWVARVSPDRAVCSYVARIGGAVAVTNSEAQLRRLVAVSRGDTAALAIQPEYVFFRSRYARGAADESALIVLTDATIRRWCGPRWRIGASRRTRAAAALSEAQARWLEASLAGRPLRETDAPAGLGPVVSGADGARSSIYGSLAFMTPIAELDLARVSSEESELYGRWRDGYQRNWSGSFDPIAVRLGVGEGRLSADVTVRPLIVASDYRDLVQLAGTARIAPQACDPHAEALLQGIMAIDRHAPLLGEQVSILTLMLPDLDPLGWLGQSVSLYVDDDPLWEELRAAEDPEDFLEHNWMRMPVALHAEVGNGLLLTGFLVGVRGLVEQSGPDMTVWENHTYREEPYVSIRPSARAIGELQGTMGDEDVGLEQAAVYYAASGDGLVVSLNRPVIERAIDRRLARKAADAAAASAEAAPAWLGEHLGLRLNGRAFGVIESVFDRSPDAQRLRSDSWANLPILNEWHRLFPGEDPVAAHERLWHRRLLCPGGGSYRWNDAWQTMESTVYGHPGEPRDGPALPPALARIVSAAAGLTFEADGLRARVELETKSR